MSPRSDPKVRHHTAETAEEQSEEQCVFLAPAKRSVAESWALGNPRAEAMLVLLAHFSCSHTIGGSGERWRRPDLESDLAFSNSTFHWIGDHEAVLGGSFGALKRGGRIFLSMSGRGAVAVVLSVIAELAERTPWTRCLSDAPVPWHFFVADEYMLWVPAAGFSPRRLELVPRTMR
jgi:hypothetical protein